jgi:glycosyltransferase involved in cell wall biosynthesis
MYCSMRKVIHVITSLSTGGAEITLYRLITSSRKQKIIVICLTGNEVVGERIARYGCDVVYLNMPHGKVTLNGMVILINTIRNFKPDIVFGWMYHGNLAAVLGMKLGSRNSKLFWNIRQSLDTYKQEKVMTRYVILANKYFSNLPDAIVYNSRTALKHHVQFGFSSKRNFIIPNGVDTNVFKQKIHLKKSIREKYGIDSTLKVIGLVARYHPVKGHEYFFHSARILSKWRDDVCFVLAGRNVSWDNKKLLSLIVKLGIKEKVYLLGEISNIVDLNNIFDLATSTSLVEGFSNTTVEAMACGIPCIVTDVGDSSEIVGKYGRAVPSKDSYAFADACNELLSLDKRELKFLGDASRERVVKNYGIQEFVCRYEELFSNRLM